MAQTSICRGVATTIHRTAHRIGVFYHNTEVVSVERVSNGMARVTLCTGGYFTNTTKTRMNQFAAQFCHHQYGVYQKKGEWFVSINRVANPVKFIGHTVVFVIEADKVDFATGE
jgi:hypothetical protein